MATYRYFDENGRPQTISGVLDPVALTGVSTTSASNILTCASTTGVYPGMPISCPNFPLGVFVHSVKSATELELWLSVFNLSTGVASTTAALANATANGSSLLARAHGYHPVCIIAEAYFMGAWRNNFVVQSYTTVTGATAAVPGSISASVLGFPGGIVGATSAANSDYLAATPLKRHNGEVWGVRPIVHTGGHIGQVPAHPKSGLIYTGA